MRPEILSIQQRCPLQGPNPPGHGVRPQSSPRRGSRNLWWLKLNPLWPYEDPRDTLEPFHRVEIPLRGGCYPTWRGARTAPPLGCARRPPGRGRPPPGPVRAAIWRRPPLGAPASSDTAERRLSHHGAVGGEGTARLFLNPELGSSAASPTFHLLLLSECWGGRCWGSVRDLHPTGAAFPL